MRERQREGAVVPTERKTMRKKKQMSEGMERRTERQQWEQRETSLINQPICE